MYIYERCINGLRLVIRQRRTEVHVTNKSRSAVTTTLRRLVKWETDNRRTNQDKCLP